MVDVKRSKRLSVVLNIAFWLVLIFLISLVLSKTEETDRTLLSLFLQGMVGISLIFIPITYFNALVLIPRFLLKKKYWQYGVIVVLLAFIWQPVPIYLTSLIDARVFGTAPEGLDDPMSADGGLVMLFVIILSTMVNMTYRALKRQKKVGDIENERLNTELMVLRDQISPHFFFNTLNNLYALSLEESKETPKMILKLSEMMRYTIYDCNATYVSLSDEINYLENYISLQQVRLHQEANITFDRQISNTAAEISPMVLIVFLENAFKHGIYGTKPNEFVKMHINASDSEINFKLENSIGEAQEGEGGIGLVNVEKRLNLIYGERHDLQISNDGKAFSVHLRIDL